MAEYFAHIQQGPQMHTVYSDRQKESNHNSSNSDRLEGSNHITPNHQSQETDSRHSMPNGKQSVPLKMTYLQT